MHDVTTLGPLPPEPWGRKLKRAREDVAGLTTREAAELIGRFVLTSYATISRLEGLDDLPAERVSRARAYLGCLIYGVAPAELGLSPDDLPPGVAHALKTVSRRRLTHRLTSGYQSYDPLTWGDAA